MPFWRKALDQQLRQVAGKEGEQVRQLLAAAHGIQKLEVLTALRWKPSSQAVQKSGSVEEHDSHPPLQTAMLV